MDPINGKFGAIWRPHWRRWSERRTIRKLSQPTALFYPIRAPNWRDVNSLEGRVLSHGEEEDGRRYLMLEGTDGRVYYLRYTPELDEARSRGELTTNSFVVINKTVDADRRRRIVVANLGNAEALFENRGHFRGQAKRLIEHGVNLSDDERWGGWLGRYYEKLREAVYDLDYSKGRYRERSLGLERWRIAAENEARKTGKTWIFKRNSSGSLLDRRYR
jgi:hypothetical protein